MNDYHSGINEKVTYIPRWITPSFLEAVKEFQVVVITGARQVGKSTLITHVSGDNSWRYLTLDDFELLQTAKTRPQDLLLEPGNLIIDEVQKAPQLMSAIKKEIDQNKKRHFILSGSANLLLMQAVSETLAGRAVYRTLYTFALGEIKQRDPLPLLDDFLAKKYKNLPSVTKEKELLESVLIKGFFPPVIAKHNRLDSAVSWMEGFVATFLERDLRQLSQVENLSDFRRLMGIMALRSGQMINQSEVSRDANISQPTAHRYINLLETALLAEKVPAYAINRTKRLIKSPKFYWCDCGLASFLMGYNNIDDLKNAKAKGALFETLVYQHLKIWASLLVPNPKIYYWRTTAGQEIDFVIEKRKNLLAIEVKCSENIGFSDVNNLKVFMEEYPETTAGIIIYLGKTIRQISGNIYAVPWEAVV